MNKLRNYILKCHTAWYWFSEASYDVYVSLTDWRPVLLDRTSLWSGALLGGMLTMLCLMPDSPLLSLLVFIQCAVCIKIIVGCSENQAVRAEGTLEARLNMLQCMEDAVVVLQGCAIDPKLPEWRYLQQAIQDLRGSNSTAQHHHKLYRQGFLFRIQQWCYEKYQFLTGCHKSPH